nr:MAG TPA: hypothetical protein [Caudoviricetes sp.]
MKRAIDVSTEVREGIRKTFKVSDQAIWLALTFDPKRGMSDKAKRIRQYAKINGGVEIVVAEKDDTLLFDHEGSFRQYFTNGAVLEFDKKTGNATIFFKGKEMVSVDDVMVREMNQIQTLASGLNPGRFSKEVCVLCLKECYNNRVKVGG